MRKGWGVLAWTGGGKNCRNLVPGIWAIEEIPIFLRATRVSEQRKVVYLARIDRVVETNDYCPKSVARIQPQTKAGNEITSFPRENTAALDRIIAAE